MVVACSTRVSNKSVRFASVIEGREVVDVCKLYADVQLIIPLNILRLVICFALYPRTSFCLELFWLALSPLLNAKYFRVGDFTEVVRPPLTSLTVRIK